MIHNAVDARQSRLPILPDDWRKHAPHLCDDFDADYLLIDAGPDENHPRYTIIGLRSEAYSLHFCDRLCDVQAPHDEGGLDVESMLMVPLHREHGRHQGHVGLLYCEERSFEPADIAHLQSAATEVLSFLGDR